MSQLPTHFRAQRLSRRALLQAGVGVTPLLLAACRAPLVERSAVQPIATPTSAMPESAPVTTPLTTTVQVSETAPAAIAQLLPTPACNDDDDEPTPAQTEGPYYTPNTPQRSSLLEPGMAGTPILVTGYVLATTCQPVAQALLDFWHCDDAGVYDNEGYRLRGHFFSDDSGRYHLETIVPGLYPGRTRHFHVKVQAPNGPILTTQLYFPNEPQNARDGLFRPECLLAIQNTSAQTVGNFNFVLNLG